MPKNLHISRDAYGRRSVGIRVHYLLAPGRTGDATGIPERVVLHRWTKRQESGYRFAGSRLAPSAWRAIAKALGPDVRAWKSLDVAALTEAIDAWRAQNRERRAAAALGDPLEHLSIPSAPTVHALIHILGARRLRKIVARHLAFSATRQSGVPDLFLYTISDSGRYGSARFVEVKKPEERVKREQTEEIEFLRSLKLEAQIFRLKEPAA